MSFTVSPSKVEPAGPLTASGTGTKKRPTRIRVGASDPTMPNAILAEFKMPASSRFSKAINAPGGPSRATTLVLQQQRSDGVWAQTADVKLLIATTGGGGGTTPDPNPPPTPPPDIAPQNIAVSGQTTTSAVISWSTTDASTGYVEYGTTTGYGSQTTATSSGTTGSRTLTGLTPGQTYHFRVVTNSGTTTLTSGDRQFSTTAAPTLPGPPQSLVATGGNAQVVLTWAAPSSNGGSAITGYRVFRNGTSIATPGNVLTYTATGLTNGTTYTFTVAAITAIGEGPQSAPVTGAPSAGGDTIPPVISNIVISNVTQTGFTVDWDVNEGAQGQLDYGLTSSYGLQTTLEASYLTHHSQAITGRTAGETIHFRVRATDAAGNLRLSTPDRSQTLTSIPPDPIPPQAGYVYGPGLSYGGKNNHQLKGTNKCSHRFVATTASNCVSYAFNQRGCDSCGTYSGGTGGTIKVSIQTDSGGLPTGTVLGSFQFNPTNPPANWEHKEHHNFVTPFALTPGTTYHIVHENVGASTTNWISTNEAFGWLTAHGGVPYNPRQPVFSDTFAVLYYESGGWHLQNGDIPVHDLVHADGTHEGNMYFASLVSQYGTIAGTNYKVRERFTVSGGTRTVNAVAQGIRRTAGTGALHVRLETGTGTLIEEGDIPASAIPVSAPGSDDNRGQIWSELVFSTARTLTNGSTYNVVYSCPSGTEYNVLPIRWADDDMGAWDSYHFRDGAGNYDAGGGRGKGGGQQTTNGGSSWADIYPYAPQDVAMYFR